LVSSAAIYPPAAIMDQPKELKQDAILVIKSDPKKMEGFEMMPPAFDHPAKTNKTKEAGKFFQIITWIYQAQSC
jgi:hypothetical protein